LPADVYDALELSALAYGGIGAGKDTENMYRCGYEADAIPWCAYGHARAAQALIAGEVSRALSKIQLRPGGSDFAVNDINLRLGSESINARVSFAEWCAELRVVRGV